MTLKQLAPELRRMGFLEHPVVDLSGLSGAFDFSLTLTLPGQRRLPTSTDADRPPDISVFEAFDKLGLKLEVQKQAVTVMVIDNTVKMAAEAHDLAPAPKKAAEFEVATIHPSKPGTQPNMRVLPSGQAEMTSMPMRIMVREALGVQDDRIVGMPKWADTERFDFIAKASPGDLNVDTLPMMLRTFLVGRFKLATHEDEQPADVYALTASKGD